MLLVKLSKLISLSMCNIPKPLINVDKVIQLSHDIEAKLKFQNLF